MDVNVKTSHLMKLPREIRDQIYAQLLTVWPHRRKSQLRMESKELPPLYLIDHGVHPEILRVSKQVHREAKETMLRINTFVRVSTTDPNAMAFLAGNQVPLLAFSQGLMGDKVQFSGIASHLCFLVQETLEVHPAISTSHNITYAIWNNDKVSRGSLTNAITVLPCLKDLPSLLRAFCSLQQICFKVRKPDFILFHRQPLENASTANVTSPSQTDRALAERVLRPFRDHIRDAEKFQIIGSVDPDLHRETLKDVARRPWHPPRAALEQLQAEKARADDLCFNGEHAEAERIYSDVMSQIAVWSMRFPKPKEQSKMKALAGPSILQEIGDLNFDCAIANVENGIEILRYFMQIDGAYVPNHPRPSQSWAEEQFKQLTICLKIMGQREEASLGWRATQQQKAKSCYHAAILHSIPDTVGGNFRASQLIERAKQFAPDDIEIGAAYTRITRPSLQNLGENEGFGGMESFGDVQNVDLESLGGVEDLMERLRGIGVGGGIDNEDIRIVRIS